MERGYYWVKYCKTCNWEICFYEPDEDAFFKIYKHIKMDEYKKSDVYEYGNKIEITID